MAYVTSLKTRLTRSARGELFNPLIYPFLMITLAHGIAFVAFPWTETVQVLYLYYAMTAVAPWIAPLWGALAIAVIFVGIYVLVFNKPPVGKANSMVAWMLWLFATIVFLLTANFLAVFTVSLPNLIFWTWQYFSLLRFRHEDLLDNATMERYDSGLYDDKGTGNHRRITNRYVDEDDRTP